MPDIISIPVNGGISEGGLIVLGVLGVVLVELMILLVLLVKYGPRILAGIKSLQDQVANDHTKADGSPHLLRDDLDGKHNSNDRKLDTLVNGMSEIRRDVQWLTRRLIDQGDRIDTLEDTDRSKGQPA